MPYQIHIAEKLEKILKKLPKRDREQILIKIDSLADNPRPSDCKKLHSHKPPMYRVRFGDYRILYHIEDHILLVLVVEIGNRKEVYR